MKRATGIAGILIETNTDHSRRASNKRYVRSIIHAWHDTAFAWINAEGQPISSTTAFCTNSHERDRAVLRGASFFVNHCVKQLACGHGTEGKDQP